MTQTNHGFTDQRHVGWAQRLLRNLYQTTHELTVMA